MYHLHFLGGDFINQACSTDRLSSRSMPCSISIGSGEKCAYFDLVISVDTAVVSCHYLIEFCGTCFVTCLFNLHGLNLNG